MPIVLVKHQPFSPKEYAFTLPKDLIPNVYKGIPVLCDTCRGPQPGIVTIGPVYGEGTFDIAFRCGATFPLREILDVGQYFDVRSIQIPAYMSPPSADKLTRRAEEYRRHGCFLTRVAVGEDGVLQDGYTAYLAARTLGLSTMCALTVKYKGRKGSAT